MSTPGPPDPQAIPCPKCEAGKGERCYVANSGRILPRPHVDRVRLAATRQLEAEQRANGDAKHRIEGARFQRIFADSRVELEQRGDWTQLAAEELEALVLNMEAAAKARRGAAGEPLVLGSTGQKVANPLWGIALRLDAQALSLARALKLVPENRPGKSPRVGAEDVPDGEDGAVPAEPGDELAALDELANKRKARHGQTA